MAYFDPDRLKREILIAWGDSADRLIDGGCKTMEQYADKVGFCRGLRWVQEKIDELSKSPDDIQQGSDE